MEDIERYADWTLEANISAQGFETTSKLAAMLVQRLPSGSAIIVSSKPRNMLPAIRKKWVRVLRLLETQRAATRSATAKREMKQLEEMLAAIPFTCGQPEETLMPSVWLLEPDDLGYIPPSVANVFILSDVSLPMLLFFGRRLPADASLVVFRRGPFPSAMEHGR